MNTTPQNTPFKQTEIGPIPQDWEVKKLGETVDFLDGKRKPIKDSERAKMRGQYPYYGASGIIDYVNAYLFDEDLILLGEDGENILSRSVRLAFRISGKVWVNNHAHVLKPKNEFDIGYLTEILESINYEQYNTGTAQPKLNQKVCSQILIPFPPTKAEQTAIATALSDADALIGSLEKLIHKKRLLKQATMQHLLTPKEDWEVKKLGEVCEITSSKRIFEDDYVTVGIPFYRGKEISLLNENKRLDDEFFISEEKYEEIKRMFGVPVKDDILITAVGTLGNVYLIPNNNKFYFKDGNLIWLKNIKNINPNYLSIQISWVKNEIINNAIGSSQKALTIVVLKKQLIPLPTNKAEQIRIVNILSDMDAELSGLEGKLEKYRQLKQGMMQQLLTGKIRLV